MVVCSMEGGRSVRDCFLGMTFLTGGDYFIGCSILSVKAQFPAVLRTTMLVQRGFFGIQ